MTYTMKMEMGKMVDEDTKQIFSLVFGNFMNYMAYGISRYIIQ